MTYSTRSVAVAPDGSSPSRRKPTTIGMRLVERLAEQRRLGLDAADAPADDAEAVDHRGVRVGADQRVGQRARRRARRPRLGQVLQVDLVDDPGPGWHDAEVGEGLLRPAQQRVALAVALVLAVDVDQERGVAAELVDLDASGR